jgi:hypothetical protein
MTNPKQTTPPNVGGQPAGSPQAQQAAQAQAAHQQMPQHQQLAHALHQHAQAAGLSLQGIDWAAVAQAVTQLIAAFARAGGGQATP